MNPGKIKIVFGLNDFLVGGTQKQFAEQVKFFDKNVYEIILITLFQFPNKPDFYKKLPPDLEIHKLGFSGKTDIGSWLKLYSLLRRLQPDIVVSSLFFSNTIFRVLKPIIGYHSIAREHNTYTDKSFWNRTIDRLLAHFSYRIVANSSTVASFTHKQEQIPMRKFVVIHNGIDTHKVDKFLGELPSKSALKQEMGFDSEDRIILNVARLTQQKNHKLLIEGFLLFSNNYPSYKLAIVGDGELRDILERHIVDAKAQEKVIFYGQQNQVWKFYKIADALVSTSDIEGMSNSYLEAFAAGIPVVATNTAGTDELIHEGENGFFIHKRTPENVRVSIEKISNESVVNKMRERCLATAELFDVRKIVKLYEALFQSIKNK